MKFFNMLLIILIILKQIDDIYILLFYDYKNEKKLCI